MAMLEEEKLDVVKVEPRRFTSREEIVESLKGGRDLSGADMSGLDLRGITLVGLLAAVCTTGSFLPQAIKTWRTRHVADLSLVMYVVLCTGVALWLAYGLLISDVPIVVANVVTLVLAGSILVAIVVDRMHRSPRAVTIEVEATDAADGDTGEAQP